MNEANDSLTVSPSHLLARLNALRSLQDAARDKLQRQRQLCRSGVRETNSEYSIQDVLSQISTDASSYRTFQSLLRDAHDDSSISKTPETSRQNFHRIRSCERIDGVVELNLSQESELILDFPSRVTTEMSYKPERALVQGNNNCEVKNTKDSLRKCIELEEIPILSQRKDFETLLSEKIQIEKVTACQKDTDVGKVSTKVAKKPFLRRGEGLSRFGLKKDDLIIQNTKSLPWRQRSMNSIQQSKSCDITESDPTNSQPRSLLKPQTSDQKPAGKKTILKRTQPNLQNVVRPNEKKYSPAQESISQTVNAIDTKTNELPNKRFPEAGDGRDKETRDIHQKNQSNPPKSTKTWAAILTEEQETFLRQLKQSSYYKNFESPAKSVASQDISCDDSMHQVLNEKELAEQNLFELLENKVSNASFCSQSSFLQRFIHQNKPDCSGDNTPMLLQRCLVNNPQFIELFPPPLLPKGRHCCGRNEQTTEQTIEESCVNESNDCDHETCSSASSCCTCKTVEETNASIETSTPQIKGSKQSEMKPGKLKHKNDKLDQTVTPTNEMKAEMAEMNAKLVATSELLKDRLQELESEIEVFRQENAKLVKMRAQFDAEKQHFYNEKSAYEQKSNEEKILSEYYLAEEKEKLAKQKQVYERYVREMRGRLNKKEKDEVITLKKDIEELKEEFRTKEARSTACIARLRTQLKMVDKEKNDLREECEKLKKENKRIQHINTNTRRLSNLKYLAEINKKLAQIDANEKMVRVVPDVDAKYISSETENRGRAKKLIPVVNRQLRTRSKSVPNLMVTSRYAKYFSQRDAASQMEKERSSREDLEEVVSIQSNNSSDIDYNTLRVYENNTNQNSSQTKYAKDYQSDENLENVYSQQFGSMSDMTVIPTNDRDLRGLTSSSNYSHRTLDNESSTYLASYASSRSKSPIPPLNLTRSNSSNTLDRSKSPISILSNRSSVGSRKSAINDQSPLEETLPESTRTHSSEDISSRRSLTRTNLNPTEIKRPDGTRELRFPNGNVKIISADGKTSKFVYYNGDIKETFCDEGKIKYYYADTKTYHTTHVDGLEVLQFPDGQIEKRYADGSVEIRLPNGSIRYTDPRNKHVSEEWRFPDGAVLTLSRDGEQVVRFPNGQVEVHAKDHKRREYPDGTVKLVYSDGTSETRYSSGRVRIKDQQGALIMDSAASR